MRIRAAGPFSGTDLPTHVYHKRITSLFYSLRSKNFFSSFFFISMCLQYLRNVFIPCWIISTYMYHILVCFIFYFLYSSAHSYLSTLNSLPIFMKFILLRNLKHLFYVESSPPFGSPTVPLLIMTVRSHLLC